MSRNAIALYVFLAIALSWCVQIPAIMLFGLDSAVINNIFILIMWSPTLLAVVFIVRSPVVRFQVLWRLGKLVYLPLGVVVQTAIGFAVVAILIAAGLATSDYFSFQTTGVDVSGAAWLLGDGTQSWIFFLINVTSTAIAFSILGLVAATGEEFAWRGFLQGQLTRQFGVLPGIMLLAVIWWAWHLPALLMGYNFPEHPYIGSFILFPLLMIGASLFFGWLTIKSGSFWPAALAHGTVNSIQQGLIENLQLQLPQLQVDILRTALILGVGIICFFLLRLEQNKKAG
ncbi:type II CAAX endopeptidase family protein [Rheinheimera sp. 1928-s]|uniref:CPBP family intramembrane glutamic endopeptidase n=1 Tax=Rheinheimera sp. 1928-s TaxID=3033803 RepID=UPI00262153CA|nr:type II CAAX endopeptidase family protein [Rheinheimera sp. 1928-s]MDF3124380.1 type II CAAX endopeptidase family protein [Rheinheimera sp. 1928-s]